MSKRKKYSVITCILCMSMLGCQAVAAGFGPGTRMYTATPNYQGTAGSETRAPYGNYSAGYGPGINRQQPCLGGAGAYGPGYGAGSGNSTTSTYGPALVRDICEAPVVTVAGIVAVAAHPGSGGFTVDTGGEMISVYGIGPFQYWENLGIARPGVGEEVEIAAYNVTFSDGTARLIAGTVWLNGEAPVELRDDSCLPLWRGGPRY